VTGRPDGSDAHTRTPPAERVTVRVFELELPIRTSSSARRRELVQAVRFCAVGGSGYAVNLVAFQAGLRVLPYPVAFALAFAISAAGNFALNRVWTFRARSAPVAGQFLRFAVVSVAALGLDLLLLWGLVERAGVAKLPAAAAAIAVVTPLSFLGNRLWSFAQPAAGPAR
jgi:dolichol-phosphate mannosyltransferase